MAMSQPGCRELADRRFTASRDAHVRSRSVLLRTGLALVAVTLASSAPVQAQFDSSNVSLLSWLDLGDLSAPGGCDCWGYTSSSGREYALMGVQNALKVVEITDPTMPVIRESIPHNQSGWCDMKVFGQYTYLTVEGDGGGGMQVIDLGNVDAGVVTLVNTITSNGLNKSHNVVLNTDSGFLYLVGSNLNGGAAVAYDLNIDPVNPPEAGRWDAPDSAYHHDAHVVTYTEGTYAGREILFGFSESRGVDIVDVTDKNNMFLMSRTSYEGVRYCHQGWTTPDRRYLYVDDELDEGVTAATTRTIIFNIEDLTAPQFVGTFTTGLPSRDHNLYVDDCILYEANYSTGMRVISIANPEAPTEVGFFDTFPENDAVSFDGAWSVYPYFASGTVIVSDIDRGLFVLDPSAARAVADNLGGLLIDYPQGRPLLVSPDGDTTLDVKVLGSCGGELASGSSILHVDSGNGFELFPLAPGVDGTLVATFPATDCRGTVQYYLSAETIDGTEVLSPSGAPAETFTAYAASNLITEFEDDFELSSGWTTGPDTADTGAWVLDDPAGTDAQPELDHTPDPGVKCFFTGQNPAGNIGDGDVDGGSVVLTSPIFSVEGCGDALITYHRWYYERDFGDDIEDGFLAEISNDGGDSWTVIESLSPGGGGWEEVQFRVGELLSVSSTMQLRFTATDGVTDGDIIEAAIDDVRVERILCPCARACTTASGSACPEADVDCNGVVNGLDVAIITNACNFGQISCAADDARADVDGNQIINGLDVSAAVIGTCFGL